MVQKSGLSPGRSIELLDSGIKLIFADKLPINWGLISEPSTVASHAYVDYPPTRCTSTAMIFVFSWFMCQVCQVPRTQSGFLLFSNTEGRNAELMISWDVSHYPDTVEGNDL